MSKVKFPLDDYTFGSTPVTFSDIDMEIKEGQAYVFRPENPDNTFKKLELNALL